MDSVVNLIRQLETFHRWRQRTAMMQTLLYWIAFRVAVAALWVGLLLLLFRMLLFVLVDIRTNGVTY